MKVILGIICFFAVIIGMSFFDLGMSSFFRPKYRALDSKVFKESEQYNDGMIRDLENLMYDYTVADTEEKKQTIKSLARHRFSVYPKEKLTYEQIQFLRGE